MCATFLQHVAIGEEVRTSIELIKAGLGQLQRINGANDFYHLPMLNLASGFERLMKTAICFHILNKTDNYPTEYPWPKGRKGHDLIFLLDKIVRECFYQEYLERTSVAREDSEYLLKDAQLREMVKILSGFGQITRYHNLEIVCCNKTAQSSPEQMWMQLEVAVIEEDENGEFKLEASNLDKLHKEITTKLIIKPEIFARALVRLFTIGGLGDEAKRHTGTIAPFLFLRDDQLGKTLY